MAEVMAPQNNSDDLVVVDNLVKYFPVRSGLLQRVTAQVKAVDGVSFSIKRGETLGLVGESGCGKTTVGRTLLRLIPRTSGSVYFDGEDIFGMGRQDMKQTRQEMQIIFQDPFSSSIPGPRSAISSAKGCAFTVSQTNKNASPVWQRSWPP